MRPSRRGVASLAGLALGLAGCDTVPAGSSPDVTQHAGALLPHDVAIVALALGLGLAVLILASIARQAVAHHRLSHRLRAESRAAEVAGRLVGLVPGVGIALVTGVRHPTTYVSDDVLAALAPDEITAVLSHERHHELTHAPLRLILLAGIESLLWFAGPVARALDRARARIEIEADAHALAQGSTRQSIARAIMKLGGVRPTMSPGASFASSADSRLRALLGDEAPTRPSLRSDAILVTAVAALVIVACSALPL